ncbi:MAG: hypothetical protein ACD_80C00076G0001 [uncultured bacterium (gcode 4)]|uniref:Uncharacterized protein n=1 Tax=uncultured bacterium (gcode 4) TaxID=1234023 RepID=K1XYD8_9BACT|nr:MAG: hypothetical protein ACD_80C00076G0001 [uncultured bacterium (gcode 4)]
MEINIAKKSLKTIQVDMSVLVSQISKGKAVLFTGAGFSKGTSNIEQQEPPLSQSLAIEICRLGGFEEDNDLRYAAEYFISNCDKNDLISLLKRKYVLNNVAEEHVNICKIDWKRFYTTNYDKCIEIAAGKSGKVVDCVNMNFSTAEYYKRDGLCIHLNGSIDSLTEDSLETSFKLSTSSYISADSFLNSDWFYCFKKDLERSSAIVFVGYSMYDIEVQRILFENETLKEKIYFITDTEPSPKSVFTLSKFGNVIPIGVKGFSKFITDNNESICREDRSYDMQSMSLYELTEKHTEIRDPDVEAMFMYGVIDKEHIDNGVTGEQRLPYLILRTDLDIIAEFAKKSKNTIIYGGLGNGKSILLKELRTYLTVFSFEVYDITDWEGDYIGDIDYLSKSSANIVIMIDSYERYIDLIIHYIKTKPKNITIIASARTAEHERLIPELKRIGFEYNEINVDTLSSEEASKFVDIVDNIGLWGDEAGLPHNKKIDLLRNKNALQISLSLLYLLEAPQIKERITSLVSDLFKNPEYRDTVFAISLIEVLDLNANFSLISEVAGNDKIYSSALRQNENFKHLFKLSKNKVISKSSLFCLSLIRDHFNPSYVVNQLLKIASTFNKYSTKDFEQDRIFKAMLRFSSVERFIPDANKRGNLRRYYEDLKLSVPWLKNDPHFWLQYGMAYITFKEYPKAQQFINQAYALAKNRENYHTVNIDTQQARLFILTAILENNPINKYENFTKAHKILLSLDNDVYKFRQVQKYRDYFEDCFTTLSKNNKASFLSACKKMLKDMEKAEANGEINIHHQTVKKAKDNLLHIISSINKESGNSE